MARHEVFSGTVDRVDVMDSGEDIDLGEEEYHELYRLMVLARKFDEKAFTLQRRGDISTYAPHKGQEAAQIGAVYALEEEDWVVPSFRESAAAIARDAPLDKLFRRWMGDPEGQKGMNRFLPIAIPVGSQNLHAAGLGMSLEKKGEESAVIGFTGDGSTSEGDFHEALNFAGVFDAHTVFIVQNNQYAISMPVERQTESETIAQKAVAQGIDRIQVDGNDVLAVVKAVREALEKARNGEPVLLEALTYRLEDHTTSDDSTRYRSEEEVEEAKERDPLKRFREFLKSRELWNEELERYAEEAEEKIDEAANSAMEMEDPELEDMFEHVYKDTPEMLEQELEELKEVYQ